MKRTSFKRKDALVDQPAFERAPRTLTPLAKPVNYAKADGMAKPCAKDGEFRSAGVMAMAKHRPCLLLVGEHFHDHLTVVACHSNWGVHGKGAHFKAHDCFTVWGCFSCHSWLDAKGVGAADKRAAFDVAMRRQVAAWRRIEQDSGEPERFRKAASEALSELSLRPAGREYLA